MGGGFGQSFGFDTIISSTEVLTSTSSDWTLTTPLPRELGRVKNVIVGGQLYFLGNEFCKFWVTL